MSIYHTLFSVPKPFFPLTLVDSATGQSNANNFNTKSFTWLKNDIFILSVGWENTSGTVTGPSGFTQDATIQEGYFVSGQQTSDGSGVLNFSFTTSTRFAYTIGQFRGATVKMYENRIVTQDSTTTTDFSNVSLNVGGIIYCAAGQNQFAFRSGTFNGVTQVGNINNGAGAGVRGGMAEISVNSPTSPTYSLNSASSGSWGKVVYQIGK
jgi:hypothetical protein